MNTYERNYHIVAKGMSHSRAEALSRRVTRWDLYEGVWLGEVEPPIDYGRPVRGVRQTQAKGWRFCPQLLCLDPFFAIQRTIYGQIWRVAGQKSNNFAVTNPV
jgi:hypothetical protein